MLLWRVQEHCATHSSVGVLPKIALVADFTAYCRLMENLVPRRAVGIFVFVLCVHWWQCYAFLTVAPIVITAAVCPASPPIDRRQALPARVDDSY